jgi:Mg-chelatase subunit ChlI
MDRQCDICQSVTTDDEQTICSVCGAELPSASASPETPNEDLQELDLGAEIEADMPESQDAKDETVQSDDWDTGAVGGEAGVNIDVDGPAGDVTQTESKEETVEIALESDEFFCPNCKNVVKQGSELCGNCKAGTEYLVPCAACGMGIDKLAEICPHCYTDLKMYKPEDVAPEIEPEVPTQEEKKPSKSGKPAIDDVPVSEPAEQIDIKTAELGQNGKLSEKEKKAMLKKLLKEQKDLEKKLKKGQITEEDFAKRLDEIRMGNGFGPIGGYVLEEAEAKDIETAELGQNGKLSEKEKQIVLKKLLKEQRALEKQLKNGEMTEEEFAKRLDKVRMGNGFGPIGGYVLEEAEGRDEKRAEREARNELIREELAKERRSGIVNYYNLSLITLFFFVFLAIFVLMEFIFTIGNFTTQSDVPNAIYFNFSATLDEITSIPVLLFGVILTMSDLILHLWDRKMNLILSLVPTGIMILALGIDASHYSVFVGIDLMLILVLLTVLILMVILDLYCAFIIYPVVLDTQKRDELEMFLEKEQEKLEIQQNLEEEYQKMIEEEEEKLRMKDDEIDDIKTKLESLNEQIQQEEEKLRLKEEEITSIKSELDLKTQQMMEEEEKLRMKEDEMESLIQTELEKRAEDMMVEEEEKIRMKEEELIRSRNELDIQKNLFDESREKLRMKEQEMSSLKTELENQMRQRFEEQDRLRLKEAAAKMLDRGKQKRVLFPFAAMVGQEKMKRALILNAIYPEVGGVLIRGQKGTGKSVTVRGLAEILPDIEVTGCKFNCDPKEPDKFCTECKARQEVGKLETYSRPVQVVDLPLNITEDRLVGSIDIERILAAGEKSFEPGILAEAHRGILYVDEINLLDDYIVDILLDAASSGVVTIEREGMSISHPSRFLIVGSMNPEEGELRPQILDRLALQCDVVGIKDVEQRIQIVKGREEFSTNPVKFREKYEGKMQEIRSKIDKAQELIKNVTTPQRIYKLIAQICLDFDVDGHRADIIIERAARANASFEGRLETTAEDVASAAAMALPHRMKRRPSEDEEFNEDSILKLIKSREAELEG